MIIGLGTDITDINRIKETLNRFGDRFIERCFTEIEKEKAEQRKNAGNHIATYAKRFAAKEACAKALGTGFAAGVTMKDIGIVNDALGKPEIILTGGAKKHLESITPKGQKAHIHLTLSDEPPIVKAQVIIECL